MSEAATTAPSRRTSTWPPRPTARMVSLESRGSSAAARLRAVFSRLPCPAALGLVRGLEEVRPGAGRAAASAQDWQSARLRRVPEAGIEALGLVELGAGLGVAVVAHELAGVVDVGLRGGALVGGGVGQGGRGRDGGGARERQRDGEGDRRGRDAIHACRDGEEDKLTTGLKHQKRGERNVVP